MTASRLTIRDQNHGGVGNPLTRGRRVVKTHVQGTGCGTRTSCPLLTVNQIGAWRESSLRLIFPPLQGPVRPTG